ncbi:MAG TPA: prephenate dehydratase [Propionibacteriaceae bacterium]|nr:prephenate dehydratase [Micropruina sp.]HBX79689.1 prephenate dehydratase [Propionibacteriaceae bacterium]HBY23689.1 prephenate dehydratase [Propionibacteriaceae bacterium]
MAAPTAELRWCVVSSAPTVPLDLANPRIAYQGEPGANSDAACREMFPDMEPLPCPTFEDAFEAVTSGLAELAMIPIENSIAGRVADIHHLLPTSGLYIIGEYFLPIHFQLMGVPGATLDNVRVVRSHVHGLGQCRKIVRQHAWTAQVADDTAGAAREVAELGDRSVAALSPRLAASLYGLEILAEDVEDAHHNTTRFLILAREPKEYPAGNGPMITTFVFRVRNVPAALYKAMGGFATNGVNLTKLESYQLGGTFFATQFYADVEGHPQEANVALALEELGFFSVETKILGTYPASPFRAEIAEPQANRTLRPQPPA